MMVDCNIAGLGFTQGAPSATPGGAPAGFSEELAALFAGILAGLEEAGTAAGTAAGIAGTGEPDDEPAADPAAEETAEEAGSGVGLLTAPAWPVTLPRPVMTAAAEPTPASGLKGILAQATYLTGAAAGESNGGAPAESRSVDVAPAPDAPAEGNLPDGVPGGGATDPPAPVEDPLRASRDQAARALARALADVGHPRQVREGAAVPSQEAGTAASRTSALPPPIVPAMARDSGFAAALGAGHARASRGPDNQHDAAAPTAATGQIAAALDSAAASADRAGEHGSSSDGRSRPSSPEASPAPTGGDRTGPDAAPAPAFAVEHAPGPDGAEPRVSASSQMPAGRLTGPEASGVAQQLVQSIRLQARDGVNEAHVRLRPEHLGEVRISIKAEGDRIAAILHIERADVRHAVESQGQDLRTQLASHGLHLDELTVRDDSEPRHGRQAPPDQEAPARRHRRGAPDREFELESEP